MNEYPNQTFHNAQNVKSISKDSSCNTLSPSSRSVAILHPSELSEEEKEKRANHFRHFGASSIIYALFYTFCLYKNTSGITYPFFISGTLFYFFLSLKKLGISAKRDSAFYVVSILLLGISTFCTDNSNIISMNTLWDCSKYILAIFQTLFDSFKMIVRPISDFRFFNQKKQKKETSFFLSIFIGILISIPFLAVILLLLCSADTIFRSIINEFISVNFVFWIFGNFKGLCLSLFFSFFASYCIITCLENKFIKEEVSDKRTGEPLIAITVTSTLSAVYLLFSGIQIIYLFTGNRNLSYSYYASDARAGFFQLLFVCMINLILVLTCLNRFKESKTLKIILTVISLCTYIMIASSAMRMILYIQYYDLTFLRIFVLWALVVIFFLMTGVLFHIYRREFPFFRYCMTVVTVLYIGFSFSHPDYFIARYNISQIFADEDYESDKFFYWEQKPKKCHYDTDYLSELSADAAPAILNIKTLSALIDGPEKSDRWSKKWTPKRLSASSQEFDYSKPKRWMEYYAWDILSYTKNIEKEGSEIRTFNISRFIAKKYTNFTHLSLFALKKCPLFYYPF